MTLTGTGYGEGPEWDRIYTFGLWGNRQTLAELHKRIENGPVDWEAEDNSEKTFRSEETPRSDETSPSKEKPQ